MNITRYQIRHIHVERWSASSADVLTEPTYLVFYYKSIPLGQVFLGPGESVSWSVIARNIMTSANEHLMRLNIVERITEAVPEETAISLLGRIAKELEPSAFPEVCDVSVVICTRNRASSLKNCLYALSRQISKPREIIVVDNGSSTRDSQKVSAEFGVRYVREERVGLDIARNTGARAARSELVAYTDDDTLPDAYWVYRVWETFQQDESVAMTGLILAGSLKTEAEIIFEKYWPFNRGFLSKTYDRNFFSSTLAGGPPVWEIGAGANMAFRKSVFDDVGFFDERLDVGAAGCSGDSELWYRILANGLSIRYNPMAMVQHFHRDSVDGLKRQLYSYMKGFTVAMLIQYQRFGHRGNLKHLFRVLPVYYLKLLKRGFPGYNAQYKTLFSEMSGVVAGMFYFLRHKNTNPRIFLGP